MIGRKYQIHSFKHNGTYHRIWDRTYLIDQDEDYLVFANEKTRVHEANGKSWFTKEPAICFFFKDRWYNIISMLKDDGVYYYCNLASPFTIDDEAIKYIDYDLDVKVFPNRQYKILDRFEYKLNADDMKYPKDVKEIIEYELKGLEKSIKRSDFPFDDKLVQEYYIKFRSIREDV